VTTEEFQGEVLSRLGRTDQILKAILAALKEVKQMSQATNVSMAQILQDVRAETSEVESMRKLLINYGAAYRQVIANAGVTLPTGVQSQLNTLDQNILSESDLVTQTVLANTPSNPGAPDASATGSGSSSTSSGSSSTGDGSSSTGDGSSSTGAGSGS
jgi:uncharacterized membrane protein YgcG